MRSTELLCAVGAWAADRADLRAVALVGSWARGNLHADSDVDLVLLAETPRVYVDDAEWARRFGAVECSGRSAGACSPSGAWPWPRASWWSSTS